MRTKGRAVTGAAVTMLAVLGMGTGLQAQEVEREVKAQDGIIAIDATKGRDLDPTQTIRVQVRNDLVPAGSVVVTLVSLTKPELVLGAVLSNEAREWLIDSRFYPGDFRLVATGSQAGTQVSRRINTANQANVKWNLATGLVRIERVDDGDGTEEQR